MQEEIQTQLLSDEQNDFFLQTKEQRDSSRMKVIS